MRDAAVVVRTVGTLVGAAHQADVVVEETVRRVERCVVVRCKNNERRVS